MVDYPIVPAQVLPIGTVATDTRQVESGVSIVQGETLRINATNNTWVKAAAGPSVDDAQASHVALSAGEAGQYVTAAILQRGLILDMGVGAGIPAAALVVLSANAGRMAPSTDLVTGNFSTYLGTGIGTNQVLFNVNVSGTQVP